ncbi:MAG: hypothetical protein GC168_18950 [Candidatus Hydrogenedens sp.]|nr:hypothetical protein [Candidatus Hydrogenedens sp.]
MMMKLKNLMAPQRWALASLLACALFAGTASAKDGVVTTTVALGGTDAEPFANGSVRYRVEGVDTKLELEIEDLRNTAVIAAEIDGVAIGSAPVLFGQANIELESENGAVPVLAPDSAVVVTNLETGDVIATNDSASGVGSGDDEGEVEGSSEGADDHGGSSEGEYEDEGEDDHGGSSEGEYEDEGEDDHGGNSEGEYEDEGEDDHGGNSEGEYEDEGEDDHGGSSEGEYDEDAGELELEFALIPTANDPNASGKAELKNDNERRRIEVEVQGITAAERISVLVDGINVGTGRVREGEAEVKRDERADYTIPNINNASRVDVIDSDSGDILLSNKDVVIVVPEGEPEGSGSTEGEGSPEGEVVPVDGIQLTQKLGANGYYAPGETIIIEARMSYTGTVPVLALSIEQTLPEGWTFVGDVNNMGAFLRPVAGDSGTLTWAWINVPGMPAVLRYEVLVPETATGVQTIAGNVLYRRMGGAEYAVAQLDAPAGEGFAKSYCHSADSDDSWTLDLTELLRMIQFYNVGVYHCSDGTEDGYSPGLGDDTCAIHDADQLHADWSVDISELLRTIQFYNAEDSAYHVEFETEDGFNPGVFSLQN